MIMAQAFCGNTIYERNKKMSVSEQKNANQWAQGVTKDAKFSLNHIGGVVFHLWHGERANRQYTGRHKIAKKIDFAPETDIEIDTSGAWKWASQKPQLHEACTNYFVKRKEDG